MNQERNGKSIYGRDEYSAMPCPAVENRTWDSVSQNDESEIHVEGGGLPSSNAIGNEACPEMRVEFDLDYEMP
jgi:hypothetical protein